MTRTKALPPLPPDATLLGNFRATANGAFGELETIPTDAVPGHYRLIAQGRDENGLEVQVEVRFDVVTESSTGSTTPTTSGAGNGEIPWTGSDPAALIAAGAGALIVGRLLYEVRSRRSDSDGSATPS